MRLRILGPVCMLVALMGGCAGLPTTVSYDSQGSRVFGTMYRPDGQGSAPGVIVLHTASGSSPHEEAVAARLAKAGFVSMALSYSPPTSGADVLGNPERLRRLERVVLDGVRYLRTQPGVDPNRIGVVAFSLGGYFATYLTGGPENANIKAAVIYYGFFDVPEQWIQNLQAPILVLQGDADKYPYFLPRARAAEALAKKHGRSIELVVYRGAAHQFDFDYLRDRYDPTAAEDAWNKTVAFLNRYLK